MGLGIRLEIGEPVGGMGARGIWVKKGGGAKGKRLP